MRDTDYQALAEYLDSVHQHLQGMLSLVAWQPPGDGPGAYALQCAARSVLTDVCNVHRRLRLMDDIARAMSDGLQPAWQRHYLVGALADTMPDSVAVGRPAIDVAREYVRKLQRQRQRQQRQGERA